ncbi:hypothetical protein SAMN05216553_102443 [Lentzea fradiae]|uniref:Transcriptional regulator, AbiEi antitoxin, Type IV TA system n=2 Tax=Lentzea fradiae TaxID=200378 RepID=A0A1G7MPM0_9PSEU|nr:hypothetical protein SAMN05216553_102443 [Lentzea fradiae]
MIGRMAKKRSVDYAVLGDWFEDTVATRRDLLALGLSGNTMALKCRPGGGWTRLFLGVYLLSGGAPSRRQLVRGALLRAGPLTFLTGLEAARLHGVRRLPEDQRIHVLVPHGRGVTSQGLMLVERTNRAWTGNMINGFPVAALDRALIDAARRESRLDVVRALIADAVQRQLCSPDDITRELRNLRLGGTALPRQVLGEIRDGVRSAAEAWAHSLIKDSGLPAPTWNVQIRSAAGSQLAIVDAWWEEVGLAWQIDSIEFHLSPASYSHTMAQHSALLAQGVLTVHTVPSRLKKEPAGVMAELQGAYRAAAQRPRPDVRAMLWRPV